MIAQIQSQRKPLYMADISNVDSEKDFFWEQFSQRTARITARDFATVHYFAFKDYNSAFEFFKAITDKQICRRAKARKSERFHQKLYQYEVKVWGMSDKIFNYFVNRDLAQSITIRRDWSLCEGYDAIKAEANLIA